jgi:hypothetical protein
LRSDGRVDIDLAIEPCDHDRMPNCSKCGAQLNGAAKFCAECGTPVSAPQAAPPAVGLVSGRPERISFGGDLGETRDAGGAVARLRVQGTVEAMVTNPQAFQACLASLSQADRADLAGYLRGVVLDAPKVAVQQGCGVLGWGAADLLSGARAGEIVPLVASGYEASPRKLPGVGVKLLEVTFNGELSGHAPQPAVAGAPASRVDPLASTANPFSSAPPIPAPDPVSRLGGPTLSPMAVSGYGGPPPAAAAAAYGAVAGAPQGWAASLPNAPSPAPQMLPITAPARSQAVAQPPPAPQPIAPYAAAPPAAPPVYQPPFPQGVPQVAPYAGQYVPYGVQVQAPPPAQPPSPQAPPAFGPGARVLVQWADGNRYPATVQQAVNGQCLVVFPNGQQQWVGMQYLSPGM